MRTMERGPARNINNEWKIDTPRFRLDEKEQKAERLIGTSGTLGLYRFTTTVRIAFLWLLVYMFI